MNGADLLCRGLAALGVRHVFGLPGTQNVRLYEALRSSGLRAVVAADEGGAAFMAAGYARASGSIGVVTTIPGPGFLYALPGVAEARHDSVPMLWLTLRPEDSGRAHQLQRIDQPAIAGPLVKRCLFAARASDLAAVLEEGVHEALREEPGPVLLEVAADVLASEADAARLPRLPHDVPADVTELRRLMNESARPLLFAGQGAQGVAGGVRELARRLRAPVLCTSSGRGVLADTDPLAFVQDFSTGLGEVVPLLLERADLVLALGCKFAHNGSAGGRLQIPPGKLVRVDSSAAALAANYPARFGLHARLEEVLPALTAGELAPSGWPEAELKALRQRLALENARPIDHEPVVAGLADGSLRTLFAAFARAAGDRGSPA